MIIKDVSLKYSFVADADEYRQVGKQTPIAVRFSTVGGESGSADTARCQETSGLKSQRRYELKNHTYHLRDPRGFAVKFYTEEGNWDIVGNNTPIFFIRWKYCKRL